MQHFEEEHITAYSELGLSLPTRTIYIGSASTVKDESGGEETGVDYKMAEKVIKSLHILENEGDSEITIQLNDMGGDEYHGLAIYDMIKSLNSPSKIIVYGSAMSMSSIILQAGGKRVLSPNATIMVHMGSLEASIDQRDIDAYRNEVSRLKDVMNQIYLDRIREKNPRYSLNQLKDLMSTERYLSVGNAIEIGLADEVLK